MSEAILPPDWPLLAGSLADDRHQLAVRVYYEDTDFSGLVYHANYLKFFERGRSDFLRLSGIHHTELAAGLYGEPLVFAVRHMAIDFLKPARIDDVLLIETAPEALSGARVVLAQKAMLAATGEVLATANVTVAILTTDGKPRRWPKAIAEKMGLTKTQG